MLLPCTLNPELFLSRYPELSAHPLFFHPIFPMPSHSAYPSTRTTIPRALLPFVILLNELPRALVHRHPSPILHHPYPIPLYINRYYQFIPCRCPYSPQRSPTDLPLLPRSMDTSTPPDPIHCTTYPYLFPHYINVCPSIVPSFPIFCTYLLDKSLKGFIRILKTIHTNHLNDLYNFFKGFIEDVYTDG